MTLHDDFSRRVLLDSATMDWQASPSPSVWRKRLEHRGTTERGRVTSIVRFDAGSSFARHPHPDGEEILVLDGVFSDETGDYPAGSYLLNPEGFEHAPRSAPGCTLFVKLRQYPGLDRRHVTLMASAMAWQATPTPGIAARPLYGEPLHPEAVALLRLDPGASVPLAAGGNEVFVMTGRLSCADAVLGAGVWLRLPPGDLPTLVAEAPTELYLKSGHLADV